MESCPARVHADDWGHYDVLMIDGRSGSGKSSCADRIVADLRAEGANPQLLRVEDLYPGWDGLVAGSRAVARALDGERYRLWNWEADEYAGEMPLACRLPLIVEGCGAITEENLDAAVRWAIRALPAAAPTPVVRALWLEVPDAVRKRRALARDGETFAPHWDRWAAQEGSHYAEHRPWLLADSCISPNPHAS